MPFTGLTSSIILLACLTRYDIQALIYTQQRFTTSARAIDGFFVYLLLTDQQPHCTMLIPLGGRVIYLEGGGTPDYLARTCGKFN